MGLEVKTNELDVELKLRNAVFDRLQPLAALHPSGVIPSATINSFEYRGEQIRLIVQSAIRKPRRCIAALTMRTTFTHPQSSL